MDTYTLEQRRDYLRGYAEGMDGNRDVSTSTPYIAGWRAGYKARKVNQDLTKLDTVNESGGWADKTLGTPIDAARVALSILHSGERDPNPNAYLKGATVSQSGTALLIDTHDGGQFLVEVRQVG